MTDEQVRAFLKQPDTRNIQGLRDSAILHFMFYTGSRIGALGSIKVKDFYEDKGVYVIPPFSKGHKSRSYAASGTVFVNIVAR